MFEAILKDKEDKVAFLNAVIKKAQTNEGAVVPELEKEFKEIQPFFTDDKDFVSEVNNNYRRLKKAFSGDELEKALDFVRARKVRNHVTKRAEEALGYRAIASGKFDEYQIVAKRVEVAIRKDALIEKTNFKNTLFTLTSENGFKDVENPYYGQIITAGRKIVEDITKKGVYDPIDCEFELSWFPENDPDDTLYLPLRLTCEKRERRRKRN